MLICLQTERTHITVFTLYVRSGSSNSSAYPNITSAVFQVKFLSRGRWILAKGGEKQVVFIFVCTPVLSHQEKVTMNRVTNKKNKLLTRKWQ